MVNNKPFTKPGQLHCCRPTDAIANRGTRAEGDMRYGEISAEELSDRAVDVAHVLNADCAVRNDCRLPQERATPRRLGRLLGAAGPASKR